MTARFDPRYGDRRAFEKQRVYSPVYERNEANEDYRTRSYSLASSTKEGSCLPWLKYGIFAANIVFMVVGSILLAMGVWLRTDSRFRDFLSERYRQVVEEAFWEAPTLYAFSYITIILGCCMIVVAFFGECFAFLFEKNLSTSRLLSKLQTCH
ncbi:unnamed protein product [Cylicostephanus goldi]|uniref:Tetraspanin n=1 Tax=Cylicostephanus goldi TaxID=71465 RepID=A0A3P6R777_CYLGO|nr:unnamed protein product [Cylicostephanus goldi]